MIHIVDQYTGRQDDDRYNVAHTSYQVDTPSAPNHTRTTHFSLPTGYDNEYHVFLVPLTGRVLQQSEWNHL